MRRRPSCLFFAMMLVAVPALAQSDTGALLVGSRDGNRSTTTASGEYTLHLYQVGHAGSNGNRLNFTLDAAIAGGAQRPTAALTSSDDSEMVEASTRTSQGK